MAEAKEKEVVIECFEKRNYRFQNDVTFEFDIDVSNPETALAEIADFKALMVEATNKLDTLQKEFAAKLEPKEKGKEGKEGGGGTEASKQGEGAEQTK